MIDGMAIQVLAGEGRPVVVKTATTPPAREALRREAARLQRGRHPGVVEPVSVTDDRLEIAWVGAHTLETAKLPVPAAAAVLAAVSETIADLHTMGIVHGRLDPSHVILTGDGRPVVCGMVGPEPGDESTGPADDVGALGALIDHLIGPDAEPEPIPERRWSRKTWSGYHRRALQTLADRATHEDLARRPTARALANAIVETVPEARLQPWSTSVDPMPSTPELVTAAEDQEADPVPGGSTSSPDAGIADALVEPTDVDGSSGLTGNDWSDPFGLDPYVKMPEPDPLAPRTTAEPIPGLSIDDLAPRSEPAEEPGPSPAPPRPSIDATPRSPRRGRGDVLVGVALLLVVVVAVRAATSPTSGGPGRAGAVEEQAVQEAPGSAPTSSRPPRSEPTTTSTPRPPDATVTAADVDVDVDGRTSRPATTTSTTTPRTQPSDATRVVQAGITYAVGEPGDVVTIADWDCDAVETPGVVRPGTGEVFLFDRWATPDEPLVSAPSVVVRGAVELIAPVPGSGCRTGIELRDGSTVALTASRTEGSGATTWTTSPEVQP